MDYKLIVMIAFVIVIAVLFGALVSSSSLVSPLGPAAKKCGNRICQQGETCSNCPQDCGTCPTTTTVPTTTTTVPTTTTLLTTTTTIANSCSDTDGGLRIDVKGDVSGYYGGLPYSYTDICMNSTLLTEYACSGTSWTSTTVWCAMNNYTICLNGACV